MSKAVVLDSSALLCLLNGEPGADRVAAILSDAIVGAVNLAEVMAKLREYGLDAGEARAALGELPLDIHPFSAEQALASGDLRPVTRALGLSLGDRACLALAAELDAVALTTDRDWLRLDIGVKVETVR